MMNMKKVYIIGIGGAGTSALAIIYKKRGFDVSGSDDGDGFYMNELQKQKIEVYDKYDSEHIVGNIDLVVHVSAIDETNVELIKARELSIEIISYAEAIAHLTKELKTIAVCGTHGKTTTTALTAHAFIESNLDPTVIVGSKIPAWGSGAYAGKGEHFIIEADEYLNKLALYNPQSVILTSIDFDHPDFFADFLEYKKVFANFVAKIPENGFLVAHGDDDDVREVVLSAKCQVFFYGGRELNSCRIIERETNESGQKIIVKFRDEKYEISTQLFGLHNAKNVIAAWLMTFLITSNQRKTSRNPNTLPLVISDGISKCIGTARRFEKKGKLNGAILIDDYAHHPEEIKATLETVKEVYKNKKITVAFHPHTFSRTETLLNEFAESLSIADEIIVLDIFASTRETAGSITAQDLVDKVDCDKKQNIHTIDELADWMGNNLTKDNVFLTLGAGDIWKVYNLL
ncbi:MAG TPA: UDP-N-acetylmuramate--L-alanine ligase [Candidatus Pacebacteria bacterium]|nr:UDP-N-acetylmuramate--L-alanine ligase [Candidatus Paceibacterota bacterium]